MNFKQILLVMAILILLIQSNECLSFKSDNNGNMEMIRSKLYKLNSLRKGRKLIGIGKRTRDDYVNDFFLQNTLSDLID
jgi:hypothetical protein